MTISLFHSHPRGKQVVFLPKFSLTSAPRHFERDSRICGPSLSPHSFVERYILLLYGGVALYPVFLVFHLRSIFSFLLVAPCYIEVSPPGDFFFLRRRSLRSFVISSPEVYDFCIAPAPTFFSLSP